MKTISQLVKVAAVTGAVAPVAVALGALVGGAVAGGLLGLAAYLDARDAVLEGRRNRGAS